MFRLQMISKGTVTHWDVNAWFAANGKPNFLMGYSNYSSDTSTNHPYLDLIITVFDEELAILFMLTFGAKLVS